MTRKFPKIVDQSNYLGKILVVDEIGLPVVDLVSELLGQGFLVYLSTQSANSENLPNNPNLFIISKKEATTISHLDYLVIIQKPSNTHEADLSDLPSGYRTIIFLQWDNNQSQANLTNSSKKSVQWVYYEEIIEPQVSNKLGQIIELRNKGTGIVLNAERQYQPINTLSIARAIIYIINHPPTINMYWLESGTCSWQALVDQVNRSSDRKTKQQVNLDIFVTNKPSSSTVLSLPVDIELFIKNLLQRSESAPNVSSVVNNRKTSSVFRVVGIVARWLVKQLSVPYKLRQEKQTHTTISQQIRIKPYLWIVIFLLTFVNLIIVGGFVIGGIAERSLSSYRTTITNTLITNTLINNGQVSGLTNQSKLLSIWRSPPLSWLLSDQLISQIPSRSFIEAFNAWLSEKQTLENLCEAHLSKWINGKFITTDDWKHLEDVINKQIALTKNLVQPGQVNFSSGIDGGVTNSGIELISWLNNYQQEQVKALIAIKLWQVLLSDKPIRLLVLLQNNYELRPTGGLVSAYGLLTVQNGHKPTIQFTDSSQLDNKIAGHVQPPVELTNQLGENRWFFRDINWDPDLAVSADRAIWYYENTENAIVDGLIVTDTEFWFNINQSFENESLSDMDQFFTDLATAAAKEKLTLSTGPFLADYANNTIKLLVNQSMGNFPNIVFRALENKDIAIYLKNTDMQVKLAQLGWDGKVKNFVKPESKNEILADYLMVNEANTGINLVNRYVSRSIDHTVVFDKSQRSLTVKVTYTNNSPVSGWPGGSYQAYLRVLLPSTVSLRSVTVNQDGIPVVINPEKINGSQYNDKAVFGFQIIVQPGKRTTYQINYTDKVFTDSDKIKTYLLLVQKQPGIVSQSYQLSMVSGKDLTPLRSIPPGQISGNTIIINQLMTTDTIFQVDFGQPL